MRAFLWCSTKIAKRSSHFPTTVLYFSFYFRMSFSTLPHSKTPLQHPQVPQRRVKNAPEGFSFFALPGISFPPILFRSHLHFLGYSAQMVYWGFGLSTAHHTSEKPSKSQSPFPSKLEEYVPALLPSEDYHHGIPQCLHPGHG